MPRLGAFEITIFDKTIFSKIKSGQWPHIPTVVNLIRKIIEDKENGKSIDCYGIYSSQSSSTTSSRPKPRPVSPLNHRVRVKTESGLLTTNPSAKAIPENTLKLPDKKSIPPARPKGTTFVRFKPKKAESDQTSNNPGDTSLLEIKKQRTLSAFHKPTNPGNKENNFYKPRTPELNHRLIPKPQTAHKPQRLNKTFLNRHTSLIQTGLNRTTDHDLDDRRQTLNDTSLNTSNILADLDDHRGHEPPKSKLEERSKSYSENIFSANQEEESTVAIEVEVSLGKGDEQSSNIQIALNHFDKSKKNTNGKQNNGYYFGITEPTNVELESYDTPQMGGGMAVDLTKTAQFGNNFEKQPISSLFPKNKESPIRTEKPSNRYALPDFGDDLLQIKRNNILTDSTITFAGRNLRNSQEYEKPERPENPEKGQAPKLTFRANKYNQSRDSKDFLSDSFGKESPHFCGKGDSNRKSTQTKEEKLKLNEEIYEYNNPLRVNSISKNPTASSRGSKKGSTTEFNFSNLDPFSQELANLKMNFIKNSGSLQKRNSGSTLDNSNSTTGKLLESK